MRRSLAPACLLAAAALGACLPGTRGRLVARAPWVEDRTIALREERLRIEVRADRIAVDVRYRFAFRADDLARDLDLVFPIPAPPARVASFAVALAGPGLAPAPLAAKLGPGALGAEARFRAPAAAFVRHRGRLRVRYEERDRGHPRYHLASGAGWRGPIASLAIEVRDPARHLAWASAPGLSLPPRRTHADGWRWRLADVEPAGDVEMTRRLPGAAAPR